MQFLKKGLLLSICLFSVLTAFATDNSFKLDFDGDGRADLALYREGSRAVGVAPQPSVWYFINSVDGHEFFMHWGRTLDVPAPGDFDGDGITDVGIYRWWDFATGDTNEWWVNKSSGGHQVLLSLEPGYNKFNRNYIGDAKAEIGQLYQVDISQNPGENCFISVYFIIDLDYNALRKTVGTVCNSVPTPVPGDYNNDGRSEIAIFDDHTFKVWLPPYAPGYTPPDLVQPMDVDIPTPGDYDGDGKTDFAGVKILNGVMVWRIKSSISGNPFEMQWGFATDKPVPADYDGDGRTDIAIWRPSNGSWWMSLTSTNQISSYVYGLPTDTPLAMPVIPFDPIF